MARFSSKGNIILENQALIIVSATRQKNVRQKNEECVCLLHFSVSHFSVWLVSMAETTTEAENHPKSPTVWARV
jgi:hypothetical protein